MTETPNPYTTGNEVVFCPYCRTTALHHEADCFLNGNEAEQRKASALRDLKMAVMQYEEEGGEMGISEVFVVADRVETKKMVAIIFDVMVDEWRKVK